MAREAFIAANNTLNTDARESAAHRLVFPYADVMIMTVVA